MPVRVLVVALVLVALVATPASAPAQGTPFGPIPEAPPQQTAPPADPDDGDEGGLNRTQELLIALAGLILVTGIAYAIIRDARERAPAPGSSHVPLDEEGHRIKGSRVPPKQRVRQNRAKARQARQARKKNR